MSKSSMLWNRAIAVGVSCLALGLPLWLANAAVASGGGCEPPSSGQNQTNRTNNR
ncbi:hypothetical protein VZH09_05600 [Synechococcus elongatus IITB7]|uniref:hypothetical protein n=1 Tax=Synechococcus elongatus TaxID=32046 RepID=UPI0030CE30E5